MNSDNINLLIAKNLCISAFFLVHNIRYNTVWGYARKRPPLQKISATELETWAPLLEMVDIIVPMMTNINGVMR